jgi:hypothetical protein
MAALFQHGRISRRCLGKCGVGCGEQPTPAATARSLGHDHGVWPAQPASLGAARGASRLKLLGHVLQQTRRALNKNQFPACLRTLQSHCSVMGIFCWWSAGGFNRALRHRRRTPPSELGESASASFSQRKSGRSSGWRTRPGFSAREEENQRSPALLRHRCPRSKAEPCARPGLTRMQRRRQPDKRPKSLLPRSRRCNGGNTRLRDRDSRRHEGLAAKMPRSPRWLAGRAARIKSRAVSRRQILETPAK